MRAALDPKTPAAAAAAAAAAAIHSGDAQAALLGQAASEVAARLGLTGTGVPGTVDVFAQKLAQILAADFTGVAMQTPLDLSRPFLQGIP